jgi:hypothetical protein
MKNPISFASLRQFCERNNVTALRCEQGFEATMQDVLDDNPDISATELKTATMCRMLEENLDYGPLTETDDEADLPDHSDRMAARHDIIDAVAEGVVNGEIVGMAQANRKALSLALERAKDMGIEAKPKHYAVQVHVEMAFLVEVDAVSRESARDLATKAARKEFSKYNPDALCENHKPDVFRATAGYITEKEK